MLGTLPGGFSVTMETLLMKIQEFGQKNATGLQKLPTECLVVYSYGFGQPKSVHVCSFYVAIVVGVNNISPIFIG